MKIVEMLHSGFPTTYPTVFFSPNKKMPNKHKPKPKPAWTWPFCTAMLRTTANAWLKMRVQRSFVRKGEEILWILIYSAPSWKSQGALSLYDFRKSLSPPNRAPQSAILISCRAGIALKKDKDRLATELSIMLHAPAGLWCTVASWMIRPHPTLCCFAHACPHLKQSNILVTSLLETTIHYQNSPTSLINVSLRPGRIMACYAFHGQK